MFAAIIPFLPVICGVGAVSLVSLLLGSVNIQVILMTSASYILGWISYSLFKKKPETLFDGKWQWEDVFQGSYIFLAWAGFIGMSTYTIWKLTGLFFIKLTTGF